MKFVEDKNTNGMTTRSIKTAAHDLNNLLNNVLNAVELLKDSLENDLKLFNITSHLEKNALLASEIVNQLSDTKDISLNNKSTINLLTLIQDVKQIIQKENSTNLNIEILSDKNTHTIIGYPTEIKRLLLNLISNAVEAGTDNTAVKIVLHQSEEFKSKNKNFISLIVSDNGPGIPSEYLNNIFEEGYTTKNKSNNRGLGLSIVKSIADKHSAEIEVHSEENLGTSFSILFPPADGAIQKKLEHKKILIAEDDKFQREVLKDLLQSMKIDVFTASTGVEALDLFISTNPDLLFIDETMPEMSGLQCLEKIREIGTVSPIVLVTGADIEEKDIEGKVSKILRKPYSFNSVKTTLMDLL